MQRMEYVVKKLPKFLICEFFQLNSTQIDLTFESFLTK